MGIFDIFKSIGLFGKRRVVTLELSRKIKSDWSTVEDMLRGGAPSQLKQALITADKLIDNALKDIVSGENMGTRLKEAKELFDRPIYSKLWEAHKMRNSLVHEVGFEPQHFIIRDCVYNIKMALTRLGVNL